MANLNKTLLIGNTTRDVEIRYTLQGTAIADFGLAVNRVWKDGDGNRQEEVTFVDIQCWGRLAEIAQQYLLKGNPVFIEGRLKLDTCNDKQSGQKRSKLRVVAESLQLLGAKSETSSQSAAGARSSQPAGWTHKASPAAPDPALGTEPDDIPFRSTIYGDVRNSRLNRRIL
jgi:single-strand DNA-binding protein